MFPVPYGVLNEWYNRPEFLLTLYVAVSSFFYIMLNSINESHGGIDELKKSSNFKFFCIILVDQFDFSATARSTVRPSVHPFVHPSAHESVIFARWPSQENGARWSPRCPRLNFNHRGW
jgi:hypothetical protein